MSLLSLDARQVSLICGVAALLKVDCVSAQSVDSSISLDKTYRSASGYIVKYPGTWWRLHDGTDTLFILSKRTRVEGAVIVHGESAISVFDAVNANTVYKMASKGALPPGMKTGHRRKLIIAKPDPVGCPDIIITEVSESDAPFSDATTETDFTCKIDGHEIGLALMQYVADRNKDYARRIAVDMLRSIRMPEKH